MATRKKPDKFKFGQLVEWESQSSSSLRKKCGIVIATVTPFADPLDYIPETPHRRLGCFGISRNHESYLVSVRGGRNGNGKPILYWPRVCHLKPSFVDKQKG